MLRRVTLALAAMAVLCVIAAPVASAKTNKTDAKQNKTLKSYGKSIKKGSRDIKKLNSSAKSVDGVLKALKVVADRADANGNAFAAAAPSVIKGLTDLRDGLVAAGNGLKSLQTLATSQEYGYAQVTTITAVGPPPVVAPEAGSFVVTPDIPDALNQAMTTQQFVAQNTGTLNILYGVRSNETDGTGASDPAALCKVTVNQGANTSTTAANPAISNLPYQPVNAKSPLTAATPASNNPFGLRTGAGNDPDQPNTFTSTVPVTAGQTYSVGLACVDTTPSATEPGA